MYPRCPLGVRPADYSRYLILNAIGYYDCEQRIITIASIYDGVRGATQPLEEMAANYFKIPTGFVSFFFAKQKKAVSQLDASCIDTKLWFMTAVSAPTIDADGKLKNSNSGQYKNLTEAQVLQVNDLQKVVESWPFLYRGVDRSAEPMRKNDVYSCVSSKVHTDDHDFALDVACEDVYANEHLLITIYRYIHAERKGNGARQREDCVRLAFLISRMYIARGLPNMSESDTPKTAFNNDQYSDQWNVPRKGPIRTPKPAEILALQKQFEAAVVAANLSIAAQNAIRLLHNGTVARSSKYMTSEMQLYLAGTVMALVHAIPLIAGVMYGDETLCNTVAKALPNAGMLVFSQITCRDLRNIHTQTWVMAWAMAIGNLDGPCRWYFNAQVPEATDAQLYYFLESVRVYRDVITSVLGILISIFYIQVWGVYKGDTDHTTSVSRSFLLPMAYALQEMTVGTYRSTDPAHAKILLDSKMFVSTCRSGFGSISRWSASDDPSSLSLLGKQEPGFTVATQDLLCPITVGAISGFLAASQQQSTPYLFSSHGIKITSELAAQLIKGRAEAEHWDGTDVGKAAKRTMSYGSFFENVIGNLLSTDKNNGRIMIAGVGATAIRAQLDLLQTVLKVLKETNIVKELIANNYDFFKSQYDLDRLLEHKLSNAVAPESFADPISFNGYYLRFKESTAVFIMHLPSVDDMKSPLGAFDMFAIQEKWGYAHLMNKDIMLPSNDLEKAAQLVGNSVPQIKKSLAKDISEGLNEILTDPKTIDDDKYKRISNAVITVALAIVGVYSRAGEGFVQETFYQFKRSSGLSTGAAIHNEKELFEKVITVLNSIDAFHQSEKNIAATLVSKLSVMFPDCSGLNALKQAMQKANMMKSEALSVKYVNAINELNRRFPTTLEHSFDMDRNVILLKKLKPMDVGGEVDLVHPLFERAAARTLYDIVEYTGFIDVVYSDNGNTAPYKLGMLRKLVDANHHVMAGSILHIIRREVRDDVFVANGLSLGKATWDEQVKWLEKCTHFGTLSDFLDKISSTYKLITNGELIALLKAFAPNFDARFESQKDINHDRLRRFAFKKWLLKAIDFLKNKEPE